MLDFINLLLNIAGLLLWLNWRSVRLDPFMRTTPATLAGTVRRAEPVRLRRWHFLAALAALLLVRALFYGAIGPEVNWSPKLDLLVVSLAFPLALHGQVFFLSALLYSLLSFAQTWMIFYFWLLALAILNRADTEPNPLAKMISLQLGPLARWPLALQAVLPLLLLTAFWMALHPVLLYIGIVNRTHSVVALLNQGLVIGLSLYFSLQWLLPALLFLHLISNYVFLGNSPVWEFVNTTGRRVLAPLNRVPLRIGKMDFAPLVGILFVVLLLHSLPDFLLRELDLHNRTIWPQ